MKQNTLPGLDGLARLMAPWRGARAHVLEYVGPHSAPLGNHGDELLGRVFFLVLRDLGITLVRSATEADLLLVRPGGALLDRYRAPWLLADRLADAPHVPLVIFPSSSWFETEDPAWMFRGRTAPTLWISRERRSHRHLIESWGDSLGRANVRLELDHDVVVSGHRHLADAFGLGGRPESQEEEVLVVARLGVESGRMDVPMPRRSWSRRLAIEGFNRLPQGRQILLRRRSTRDRQHSATTRLLLRMACELPPEAVAARLSPWSFDISDPTLATYQQYVDAVTRASLVITDRLHVALPAAILGKRTYLIESGYHKLAGVFEQSLVGLHNLTFVRRA